MTDIFDAKIVCKNCGIQMKPKVLEKDGLQLRAVECSKCGDKIIHPADLACLHKFNGLKDKKFEVKLRMVGNSHAISIPKEIVDLMNEQHRMMSEQSKRMRHEMDEIVRLAFEDFGRLSLTFGDDVDEGDANETDVGNGRVRRKVKDYGNGNVDVFEARNLDDEARGIKGASFKKLSRRRMG